MVSSAPWYTRLIHSTVALFSPRRAAELQHLDRMGRDRDYAESVALGMRLRGYRAGENTKMSTPWNLDGAPRSADAEILGDLPQLRLRSRKTVRDDPVGSGLVRGFVDDVVGIGIQVQSTAKAPRTRDRIEALHAEILDDLAPAETLDFAQLQRLLYSKLLEDGEVFIKASVRDASSRLFFEVVEADRVDTPLDAKPEDSQGNIRSGIERDRFGIVQAIWVRKFHPGDTTLPVFIAGKRPQFAGLTTRAFVRVPIEQIQHLKLSNRPGQSRGVPFLTPVLQNLRDLDLLLVAALKRSQIAACLAAFITSSENTPSILDVTAEKYGYQLDQSIVPGMIFKLFPGESITTLTPSFPTPEFEPFVILLARRIGAALGVSWQIVLKDFSKANYSSARTDLLEARKVYRAHQRLLICSLKWMRRMALEHAVLRGELRGVALSDLTAANWIPPGWQWVDPEKEAKAAQIELEIGLTCKRDLFAQRGQDWEEALRQQLLEEKREDELRAELGVPRKEPQQETSDAA